MSALRRLPLILALAVSGLVPVVLATPVAAVSAGHLTGVVRDGNGAPLAGAAVALTDPAGVQVATGAADGSGHYSLSSPAGTWDLRVAAQLGGAGYGARVNGVAVGTSSSVDVSVVPTHRFSGALHDNAGNAIASAEVRLGSSATLTAADGSFALEAPSGSPDLQVTVTHVVNTVPYTLAGITVKGVDMTRDRVEDLVIPLRSLTVAVLDAGGHPWTGSVSLASSFCDPNCTPTFDLFPGGPATVGTNEPGTVGADGLAHFTVVDGAGLSVSATDYSVPGFSEAWPVPHPMPSQLTVQFQPMTTLRGSVRDQNGIGASTPFVGLSNATVRTVVENYGAGGSYTAGVPAGSYALDLNASWSVAGGTDRAMAHGPSFTVPDASTATQDLTVPGVPFGVTVVDPSGQPVAGAQVTLSGAEPDGTTVTLAPGITSTLFRQSNRPTAADGTMAGVIAPDATTVTVSVLPPNGSSFHYTAATFPASTGHGVVHLGAATGGNGTVTVHGVIRDAAGNPLAGLGVGLVGDPYVQSGADGSYSISTSTLGHRTLSIAHTQPPSQGLAVDWSFTVPLDVSASRTVDLTVPPTVATPIIVVGPDGQPRHGRLAFNGTSTAALPLGGGFSTDQSWINHMGDGNGHFQASLFGPSSLTVLWYSPPQGSSQISNATLDVSAPVAPGGTLAVATATALTADWLGTPGPAPNGDTTSTTGTTPPTTTPPTTPTTAPNAAVQTASAGSGYWMLTAAGNVYAFGEAVNLGGGPNGSVHLEPTPSGKGYWVLAADGQVTARGDAATFAAVSLAAGEHAVSLSATPTGAGYWVFTDRGRVINRGDAPFKGDMSNTKLNGPILGSVPTPDGQGYWMVASDGGIFSFGDATFHGSMGGKKLNQPVISMAPSPDGSGYWLVASDGGMFAFDVPFFGSMGGKHLNQPITGMVPGSSGYLMVARDGGIFAFGGVPFHGSLGAHPPASPVVAVALLP